MARLQVDIDGNASGLTQSFGIASKSVEQLEKDIKTLQKTLKNEVDEKAIASINSKIKESREEIKRIQSLSLTGVNNQFNGVTQTLGSANNAATEFSRIVQDLPYAANNFGSIGNNITRLTEVFGQLNDQTGSVSKSFKALAASFLTTGNLISLGISAVVTGFTIWQMQSAKAERDTKNLKDKVDDLVESLSNQSKVLVQAADSSGKEIAQLKVLYGITQNTTLATNERKDAAQRLIKQYPDLFKKIGEEGIMLGKAKDAYDKLTTSILSTARAQAAYGMIAEKAKEQLILDETNKKLEKEIQNKEKLIEVDKKRISEARKNITAASSAGIGASSAALTTNEASYQKEIAKLVSEKNSNLEKQRTLQSEINDLEKTAIQNQTSITDGFGLGGSKAGQNAKKNFDIIRDGLNYFDQKLFDIDKKYKDIYENVKDKDLLGLARSNEEAEKLRVNMEKLLYVNGKLSGAGVTINTQLQSTQNLPTSAGLTNSFAGWKAGLTAMSSNKDDKNLENRLGKVVESGFRRGISNVLDNIDNLGTNFYEVFSNTFKILANNVSSIFNDVLATQLGNQLTKMFESQDLNIGKLSNNVSKAIVAGAGIAGGLVSSMSSKTSSVGQGIGGALSGAAAGMAFGPWGAAIGGVIGGIAGLFGAKAARKQEELQKKQLEEQQKQTKLMQYQNAKGWESSIIGQRTNQGFINGFSRSATGQLVARISGRDLLFLMEREQKLR